ncbi:hypothetical protein NC652_039017 [Populus alba x Populus x berolinensis]|nr:hypothetical protein NC652_039017 [Populus alba x Populus x berolinensis]
MEYPPSSLPILFRHNGHRNNMGPDAEELLKEFENLCTLRVRMPISSDLSNPRNFIAKLFSCTTKW